MLVNLLILNQSWGLEENLSRRLIFVLHNPGETSGIQSMNFNEGNFNSHCASFCAAQSVFQATLNEPVSDNE